MEFNEIKELSISAIVLALAFSGFFTNFSLQALTSSLIIIILVFVLHELAHRSVAKYYGCLAQFRMWKFGLIIAILGSFFGFIFAAPGAVYISPIASGSSNQFAWEIRKLTKKEFGIISISGPAINIILGFLLILLLAFYPIYQSFFIMAARISLFLAFFNLLPFPPLDGSKVFFWNRKIWLASLLPAIIGYVYLGM